MKIDFGFSDTILPQPAVVKYPTLLDLPVPELKAYTPETSIAEKFESIVRLGLANTRMKDFYDIWLLIQRFSFDRQKMGDIILQVLKNRGTEFEGMPEAFSELFYAQAAKKEKWNAFLKGISQSPIPLERVISDLRRYFEEIML